MKKRITAAIILLLIVFSMSSCGNEQDAISGVDPNAGIVYDDREYSRYENRTYGIIVEYPSEAQRVGNYEKDGYLSFTWEKSKLEIYVPDEDNMDVTSAEEYVVDVLKIRPNDESGNMSYGKSSGYRVITHEDGYIRSDFYILGAEAVCHFGYVCPEDETLDTNPTYQTVMASIRVDDGKFNNLASMSNRYGVLLEYAISMQYITDINYVNNCLGNYADLKDKDYLAKAKESLGLIREEIEKIVNYERKEGDLYDEIWERVLEPAEKLYKACDDIEKEIESGNISKAQSIGNKEFGYKLSEEAQNYLSVINDEIAEY